ncbi:hypothetical protein NCU08539 [Neurospora crassa OR74A]|uniref:HNH nuclease domain-containing protein n=1 Tax=Neurospora crassa (strain ATCC 24698 / 74-OR23-1A / CBS 708.71 / DSM 1257 / FGSC 987) TaxID=367110 RepID=Q7SBL1_NEUCR|nr:hypothetical protein NCU08539 [Neurospora crassa OR74A]EAA33785.1 hypothetical protein NCU08539 [Neurospora crassa OR74A]|eukprot:XP_963021.1 hypothetical protein NCU08539 [Neurospora crassa OR74A]
MTPKSVKSNLVFHEPVRKTSEQFLSECNIIRPVQMDYTRRELNSLSTSDAEFWRTAAELAGCKIKALEAETKYLEARQLLDPNDDPDEEDRVRWTDTMTGRMSAASLEKQLYQMQADRIARGGGVLSKEFVSLATNYLGVHVTTEKLGKGQQMTRAERVKFRQSLLAAYDAGRSKNVNLIFDPVTGTYQQARFMVAVHIVPRKLGHETLSALFHEGTPPNPFSPDNGLLLPRPVAQALDHGALAIVPNIDDEAYDSPEALTKWKEHEPKEYKWIVIDEQAEHYLDAPTFVPRSQPGRGRELTTPGGKDDLNMFNMNTPSWFTLVIDIGKTQEMVEIALLALTRAIEIRQTRLEEEASEEVGEEELRDEEDEFDWNSRRLPYWEFSNDEMVERMMEKVMEKVMGGEERVDDDDDEDEEEEGSDDSLSSWDFLSEEDDLMRNVRG